MLENRSKQIAAAIIVLIVLGIIFYFVWNVFLNTGTVIFEYSKPPFTVAIEDKTQTCLTNTCEFTLPTGPRSYTVTKDGYYEETGSVNIKRGEKFNINISLEFIPQTLEGTEYKGLKMPAGYSKFDANLKRISLFTEFPADFIPKKLPKIIENMVFAESGKTALIFEKDKASLYSFADFTLKVLTLINNAKTAIYSSYENFLFTIIYDETAQKYALKKLSLEDTSQIENLIYFTRDVIEYELKVSSEDKYIALLDKTNTPEIIYAINLDDKSRKNIFEGYTVEMGEWSLSGQYFVFKAKNLTDNKSMFYYYDTASEKLNKLPFTGSIDNFDFNTGRAFFITTDSYSIANTDFPYIIKFNRQEQATDTTSIFEDTEKEKNIILAKWVLAENEFYLVQDLTGLLEIAPDQMELNLEGTTLRLLSGSQIFDIRIGE